MLPERMEVLARLIVAAIVLGVLALLLWSPHVAAFVIAGAIAAPMLFWTLALVGATIRSALKKLA